MLEFANPRCLERLAAVCDNNLSISRAAKQLGVTQSVVSRNIIKLEHAIGGALFIRRGKRLAAMTVLCAELIEIAREIAIQLSNLDNVINERLGRPARGEIRIGATHMQARYIMPEVLARLRRDFPQVRISIRQDFPSTLIELLQANIIDLAVCTEQVAAEPSLTTVEAYSWRRLLVTRADASSGVRPAKITMASLAAIPIVTYIPGITGRSSFDEAFVAAGLKSDVIIAAADSDVIKTYVRLGLGAGVIADIALEPTDCELQAQSLAHLFAPQHTRVAYRRDRRLNAAMQGFIELYCSCAGKQADLAHRWHQA